MLNSKLFLLIVSLASAEWYWGGCPSPRAMPSFRFSSYTGNWYEVMTTNGAKDKWNGWSCPRSNWSKESQYYEVEHKALYNDKYHTQTAKSYFDGDVGKFTTCFGAFHNHCYEETVLDTDYETYSVNFSCDEGWFGIWHTEYAWVNARNKNFEGIFVESVIIDATRFGKDDLVVEDNQHCPAE